MLNPCTQNTSHKTTLFWEEGEFHWKAVKIIPFLQQWHFLVPWNLSCVLWTFAHHCRCWVKVARLWNCPYRFLGKGTLLPYEHCILRNYLQLETRKNAKTFDFVDWVGFTFRKPLVPKRLWDISAYNSISLQLPELGGGMTLNYRSGVVAKDVLWIVFWHTLFCSVLYPQIGKMCEDEHLSFKNQLCTSVASASPQLRVKKENP